MTRYSAILDLPIHFFIHSREGFEQKGEAAACLEVGCSRFGILGLREAADSLHSDLLAVNIDFIASDQSRLLQLLYL